MQSNDYNSRKLSNLNHFKDIANERSVKLNKTVMPWCFHMSNPQCLSKRDCWRRSLVLDHWHRRTIKVNIQSTKMYINKLNYFPFFLFFGDKLEFHQPAPCQYTENTRALRECEAQSKSVFALLGRKALAPP